jgi:hypothetical protein
MSPTKEDPAIVLEYWDRSFDSTLKANNLDQATLHHNVRKIYDLVEVEVSTDPADCPDDCRPFEPVWNERIKTGPCTRASRSGKLSP